MAEELIHGFRQIAQDLIPELEITAYQYEHVKSGAQLLYLENADDNKTFGVAFKTPPTDDTGIPHVLEHCVLSGSRKYKTKEPFMNLVQSSMATFLNAMTGADVTMYPIASRNIQDFRNLTDVYLDAVFYPAIYEEEKIFRQEAWRYDIANAADEIEYKGIVYSEMRGAYSVPTEVVYHDMLKELLPDTPYAFESGGEPYTITDLDIEDYKEFHRKLYHPSNARLYLYGALDIDEFLEYVDRDYLSNFSRTDVNPYIPYQEKFTASKNLRGEYSIAASENPQDRNIAAWGVVLNNFEDIKSRFMLEILNNTLFEAQSAPVRLEVEQAQLGQNYLTGVENFKESVLTAILVNASEEKAREFTRIIEDTLCTEINKGIDRELLKASLNDLEFKLKELNTSSRAGIIYLNMSLMTWLYGGDPVDSLRYQSIIEELRQELDSDIWEEFVKAKFLDNPHKVSKIYTANPGLNESKDDEVRAKLAEYKAGLSENELNELVQKNQELYKWQSEDDPLELKATIPTLKLEDIDAKVPNPPVELSDHGEYKILKHRLYTSGINYALYSFDANFVQADDLFYLALLGYLLGSVDTENYTYDELDKAIALVSGGIDFNVNSYLDEESNLCNLKFEVSVKTLSEQNTSWLELLKEIIFRSDFTDKKRLQELLDMLYVNCRDEISSRGDWYARNRLAAQTDLGAYLHEKLAGIDFYLRLKALLEDFEAASTELISKLEFLAASVFRKNALLLSLTSSAADIDQFTETAELIVDDLANNELANATWEIDLEPKNEAFIVPANVNYVAKGDNISKYKASYRGDMTVLCSMLNSGYIHNMIRAKGGAYGNAFSIGRNGMLLLSSYRDPNVSYTLDIFDSLGDYLESMDLAEEDLKEYIIGSVNNFDPVLNPKAKGKLAYSRYLKNVHYEKLAAELNEALQAKPAEIKAYAELLNKVIKNSNYIVIGNSQSIHKAEALFTEIVEL